MCGGVAGSRISSQSAARRSDSAASSAKVNDAASKDAAVSSRSAFRRKSSAAVVGLVTASRVPVESSRSARYRNRRRYWPGRVRSDTMRDARRRHRRAPPRRRGPEPPDRRHVRDDRRIRPRVDREDLGVDRARPTARLQVDFGLGKYHNRGVIDGFGGVSRGREQWTVRGEPRAAVGARGDRDRPDRATRSSSRSARCASGSSRTTSSRSRSTSCCRGVTPPFFEERNLVRNPKTGPRSTSNVIRYHQGGWATGTHHRRRGDATS